VKFDSETNDSSEPILMNRPKIGLISHAFEVNPVETDPDI